MNNPKVSIVVPIYNVENYLACCVDSLLSQTYQNIEIILVDDGSPDNCPMICDEYAKKDNRIEVIHKINGGLSDARNFGIKKATGEYIMFCDSDDYFATPDVIQKLVDYSQIKQFDIIISPILYNFDNVINSTPTYLVDNDLSKMSIIEAYKYMISHACFLVSAYGKLINKDFLLQNELFFEKGIIAEDNEWFFRVMRVASNIGNVHFATYIYLQNRPGAITTCNPERGIKDLLYIIEKSISFYNTELQKQLSDDYRNHLQQLKSCELSFCSYLLCIAMAQNYKLKNKNFNKKIKELSICFEYTLYPMVKQVAFAYKLCGIKITSCLLYKYLINRDKRNSN